jgi:hypothetical protein
MAGQGTASVDRCVAWGASNVGSKAAHFVHKIVKVKVKVTLKHATKAQKGSRGIALFFL